MVIQEQLLNWISSSGLVSLGVIDALDAIFIWKKKKKIIIIIQHDFSNYGSSACMRL